MPLKGCIRMLLFCCVLLFITVERVPAQFSLTKPGSLIISGQLTDAKSGEVLPEATVFIRSEYGDAQTKTDLAGNFLLEVKDEKQLEKFLIVFAHPDYREKDVNALFYNAFEGKARISLRHDNKGNVGAVKYKKNALMLNCGNKDSFSNKNGQPVNVEVDCQAAATSITLTLSQGSIFTIGSVSDLVLDIDNEKAKIESSRNEPVKIDIKTVMFKR